MSSYRIETRKDKVKVVRTILEAVVLLAIALAAARALLVQTPYVPYDPGDKSVVSGADHGFVVLSYFGVDRQGTDTLISTDELDEQLRTMHDLGYVTISQADIEAYYRDGTPLPDKALFIMFEDGRRDTAIFASKVLERYGYRATILSYADKFAQGDPKFLSADDLRQLEDTGYWELGTNGYRLSYINGYDRYGRFLGQMTSDQFVQVRSYLGRDYNHYLMDFVRDADGVPVESASELRARISGDYRLMESTYTSELGRVPGLYCLMHSNTGRFGDTDQASDANEKCMGQLFSMNFNRDGLALNTRDSSVYDLTRLQPQAYWSTNHLLTRLRDDLPEEDRDEIGFYEGDSSYVAENEGLWACGDGAVQYLEHGIVLTSPSGGEGTLELSADPVADVDVSVRLEGNADGAQSIYLRSDADAQNCVSVSVTNGHLVVSEREDGQTSLLSDCDLHELVPVSQRTSVDEDRRDSLAAEYHMRGQFSNSLEDTAVFYAAERKARAKVVASVADGAEEYVAATQNITMASHDLRIVLAGTSLRVYVDGQDVTGELQVSRAEAGSVVLGAGWNGQAYSQRNVADDVYDGVFTDLVVKGDGTTLYDGSLHGLAKVANDVSTTWNAVLNWFITNL